MFKYSTIGILSEQFISVLLFSLFYFILFFFSSRYIVVLKADRSCHANYRLFSTQRARGNPIIRSDLHAENVVNFKQFFFLIRVIRYVAHVFFFYIICDSLGNVQKKYLGCAGISYDRRNLRRNIM